MSTKQLYRFTAKAGPWVAGYRRDPTAQTISLTPEEAELDLAAGTIVPDGTSVPPVTPPGAILAIDRILALRGGKSWDFTVAQLGEYLAASGLADELRDALRGGVSPDRDTLAKLSATLDAAVAVLRATIATRAAAGANNNITSLTGLTTALAIPQGGTGATTAAGVRAGIGLPLVPGDPGFAALMGTIWDTWVGSLPVWTGEGAIPVPAGQYFRQGAGGPPVKAQ